MSFTDADLKRLKENGMSVNTEIHQYDYEMLQALIFRLETAEKALLATSIIRNARHKQLMGAWKKSVGKE